MSQNISRIVVIGLDGADPKIIRKGVKKGVLPCFNKLIEKGIFVELKSTIPPMSAPAWISFMTGMSVGEHGFVDFFERDINSYNPEPKKLLNSTYFSGQTLMDFLTRMRVTVDSLMLPLTYPPWKINGLLVSGWPNPDPRKAFTEPKSVGKKMGKIGLFDSTVFYDAPLERKIESLNFDLKKRKKMFLEALERKSKVLIMVFNTLDRAQHVFWDTVKGALPTFDEKKFKKHGNLIMEYYKKIDKILDSLLSKIEDNAVIFILSDHGGMPISTKRFNTMKWLEELGLMKINKPPFYKKILRKLYIKFKAVLPFRSIISATLPRKIKKNVSRLYSNIDFVDFTKTKAYHYPLYANYQGIMVNLRGRQRRGVVKRKDFDKIRERIIREARRCDLMKNAWKKEEVFHGKMLDKIPDVIIEFKEGVEPGQGIETLVEKKPLSEIKKINGTHSNKGVCFIYGKIVKNNAKIEEVELQDFAPTILSLLDLPIPSWMDGKVIKNAFNKKLAQKRRKIKTKRIKKKKLLKKEKSGIEHALKGLGYL